MIAGRDALHSGAGRRSSQRWRRQNQERQQGGCDAAHHGAKHI